MRDAQSQSEDAASIVRACIEACDAGRAVRGAVDRLDPMTNASVLAIGKAAGPMARAFGERGGSPLRCFVLGPDGAAPGDGLPAGSEVWPADHPIPTARNVEAAERLVEWLAESAAGERGRSGDMVVLLSGGASAMLCAPREPLTLEQLGRMTDALLRSGASINELNAVRKHLEVLKGGGLLRAALRTASAKEERGRERVLTLVLSDVLGDPLDVIGSGPTAPDPSTFADAVGVLDRYGLLERVPEATALLRRGVAGELSETLKPDDAECARVEHHIIGNNLLAIDAACARPSGSATPWWTAGRWSRARRRLSAANWFGRPWDGPTDSASPKPRRPRLAGGVWSGEGRRP
ncbi:MAG: glycerate-2-kinase family protein [Planctomycetota bacterium]|nr:MAG: glycerate-2-kinase family protein [Planctomycetota bacterium]